MESLSPECTPAKQRYDSCFNAWFEGYLQPALGDMSQRRSLETSPKAEASSSSSTSSSESSTPQPERARIATSWASAFRSRRSSGQAAEPVQENGETATYEPQIVHTSNYEPIDTRGKTRAQVKAEEYDRNCGKLWVEYNTCLKKAIATNPSLSSLLDQARSEHPLGGLDGLEGSAWDANANLDR